MYLSFSLSSSLSFCWSGHIFSWPPSVLRGFGLVWKAGRLWIQHSGSEQSVNYLMLWVIRLRTIFLPAQLNGPRPRKPTWNRPKNIKSSWHWALLSALWCFQVRSPILQALFHPLSPKIHSQRRFHLEFDTFCRSFTDRKALPIEADTCNDNALPM